MSLVPMFAKQIFQSLSFPCWFFTYFFVYISHLCFYINCLHAFFCLFSSFLLQSQLPHHTPLLDSLCQVFTCAPPITVRCQHCVLLSSQVFALESDADGMVLLCSLACFWGFCMHSKWMEILKYHSLLCVFPRV